MIVVSLVALILAAAQGTAAVNPPSTLQAPSTQASVVSPLVSAPDAAKPAIIGSPGTLSTRVPDLSAGPTAGFMPPTPAPETPQALPNPSQAGNNLSLSPTAPPLAPVALPIATPIATPITTPIMAAPIIGVDDPLHGFNRLSYRISQPIDHDLFRPVALTYAKIIPLPLRDGIHNALSNLLEPVVFINDVLQLRLKRAVKTAARMALNTAFGFGGLFDVAKRPYFKLPHHANGFADTMGYYGIGAGPYLYIPILGPSSLRDVLGNVGDLFAEPRLLGNMLHPDNGSAFRTTVHYGDVGTIAMTADGLDQRARADDALKAITSQSVDPYATLRSSYLQMRAGEIAALKAVHGTASAPAALDDPLDDPAAGADSVPHPANPASAATPPRPLQPALSSDAHETR